MVTKQDVIIAFVIPIICGLLSLNAVRRLFKGKITQYSFEYQFFGYVGMNVFIFGLMNAFGKLSYYLNGM